MLSAVIFDFDGIIVDSEPLHCRAFNEVLNPEGVSMPWEDYCQTYIGFDDRDAFREAFKAIDVEKSEEEILALIDKKADVFTKMAENGEAKPLPGSVELIKSLPGLVPIALCSGALRSDVDPIIDGLGIVDTFSTIVTAEETEKSKPDPAPYKLAVERLKISKPNTVIAIEDTPAGIMSAKGAGLKVLAVTNSYGPEYLTDADSITDSLANIDLSDLENMVL